MPEDNTGEDLLAQPGDSIKDKIFTIRGVQVMLDRDLAELYDVETRALNQAVKRNRDRFPQEYCFQLSDSEFEYWKSQIVISNSEKMGLRKAPFAFTERGVAMLSTVLHSKTSILVSMRIMDAFVTMRHFLTDNAGVFQRFERIETRLLDHDEKFDKVFNQLKTPTPGNSVIFFNGSFYDAKSFIADLVKRANQTITLIDDYISKVTLDILRQRNAGVAITIITSPNSKNSDRLSGLEIDDFNKQYGNFAIKYNNTFHDRFLIIDNTELYSIGASLKDAGNKTFAINKIADPDIIRTLLTRIT